MKHHFADLLDRDDNYWTIVPNRERYAYTIDGNDLPIEQVKIITITRDDLEWKKVFTFENLEELTLHEASKDQIIAITQLKQIKRLELLTLG